MALCSLTCGAETHTAGLGRRFNGALAALADVGVPARVFTSNADSKPESARVRSA